jgi:hypothetical protein
LINEADIVIESGDLEPVPELVIYMDELAAGEHLLRLQCEEEIKEIRIINNK